MDLARVYSQTECGEKVGGVASSLQTHAFLKDHMFRLDHAKGTFHGHVGVPPLMLAMQQTPPCPTHDVSK